MWLSQRSWCGEIILSYFPVDLKWNRKGPYEREDKSVKGGSRRYDGGTMRLERWEGGVMSQGM